INYSRQYAVPSNRNTEKQAKIKGYFTAAVTAWQAEPQATKDTWNQSANGKQMSGFNLYVRDFIKDKMAAEEPSP
ncbi:MAG: hypothetical protein V1872_11710, partial [bacterium]